MSLVHHLVTLARRAHPHTSAFHRDRRVRWWLGITADGTSATVTPLVDPASPDGASRGIVHAAPLISRSSDVLPMLAADSAKYVLGIGTSRRDHACHAAFVDLHDRWADTAPDDPVARPIATWYARGGPASLTLPDGLEGDQVVLLAVHVDGTDMPATAAPTAGKFWADEVTRLKGAGRDGRCLVCDTVGPLAKSLPSKVDGYLVPGAQSSGAALITVNADSIGYENTTGLAHTPICLPCADDVTRGMVSVLSSPHARAELGRDSRTTWWVTPGADPIETEVGWLDEPPSPDDITAYVNTIHTGAPTAVPDDAAMCGLTVAGNGGRVMVTDYSELPAAKLRTNLAAWWDDHTIITPIGPQQFSLYRLILVCGRWDPDTSRYTVPSAGKTNDPHRPAGIRADLFQTAYRRTPAPGYLVGHLAHRIQADRRIDAPRAALLRLAHNRTRKDDPMPIGLDPTRTDTAYLAGRVFAILAAIQHAVSRHRKSSGESTDINTTYADRYLAGAIANPRTALQAGLVDLPAWLKVLRRDAPGLARYWENQLEHVMSLVDPTLDFPLSANLNQQSQFTLGYWHQRATRPTSSNGTRAEGEDSADTAPELDGASNTI